MDYPGNTSLGSDVRDRVLGTYRQTLDLASQGNRQEASLGCDFILRLDPEFEPARALLERLEQGEGAVMVDDLRPGAPGFSASAGPDLGADALGDLDDLSLDLPEPGEEPAAPSAEPSQDLATELQSLLKARQFQQAVQRAQEEEAAVAADPQAAQLAQVAQSRLEAEPYIQSFLDSAHTALQEGDRDKAERLLDSARELDPNHPDIEALDRKLQSGDAPPTEVADASLPALDLPDLELGDSSQDDLGSLDLGSPDDGAEEGDERIRDLLQEGQQAFDQKDFQGAIDAWSRIFLIDIDHQQAAQRIEEARRLKAEHERQVEEIFHEGVHHFEAGDGDAAKGKFEQVLKLQPDHLSAKEYLHKIKAGEIPTAASGKQTTGEPRAAAGTPIPQVPDDDDPLNEEILVPPEPGSEAALPMPDADLSGQGVPSKQPMSRNFLLIGGAVLVLVILGGWFVVQQWDTFFPNASESEEASAGSDPIAAATRIHRLGNTSLAVTRLEQVAPGDPHYEEAQSLIAQWQAEAAGEDGEGTETVDEAVGEEDEVLTEALDEQRSELIRSANRALVERRYLDAEALLQQANQMAALSGRELTSMMETQEALESIRAQVELVRGGDWDYVLPDLWRMREEDPGYPDVNRLLVTSYYNLGVRDLQRGDPEGAEAQFQEAQGLAPADPEVDRLLRFARSYRSRGKDLQYQIYVKYLTFRTL